MGETNRSKVVVYDGDCPFCRNQIARIRRWDKQEVFEYVPRQTPGLDERFPKLAHEDFNTGMRLITPSGAIFGGADAVYRIVRTLPYWRLIAWLYRVPGIHALARAIYAWIAAHRRSLGKTCQDGICRLPDSSTRPPSSPPASDSMNQVPSHPSQH